ncbi:transcript antisense to ribosomal RNA protein, partial [Histoplasma capsulatum var. duboisii H88]
CFSSFDHSTCALSVSDQYLALDEIYHPFGAAFPNNSTRRRSFTRARPAGRRRDSHPLRRPVPGDLDRGRARSILCKLQLRPPGGPDFKFELLPLHSPLLRQSLLVSFPPLIDMLKFSGYPYLIREREQRSKGNVVRRGSYKGVSGAKSRGLRGGIVRTTRAQSGIVRAREYARRWLPSPQKAEYFFTSRNRSLALAYPA